MTSDSSAGDKIEFLEQHPWLPILLLLFLPFALHVPLWLLGRSTDPIWFVSGVTQGSRLFPGRPFLDPNAGFTSQALGHLVAWDWLHGIVPWWNQYTGIGVPLAGELQPEAFFLPFNLLLLLSQGLLWQQICMQIIAGLATYALLRELGLSRLAALMGGALFALNGTIAWTPGPAAVYCALPFLPLLLWGVERARKQHQSAISILAIGVAIGWSLLAGFPEPAFIGDLLALAWGLYRLAFASNRGMIARRAMTGFALGLLVAAPLLISFLDYLRQSDSFAIHTGGEAWLPRAAFSATVMPYVYGPLGLPFHSGQLADIWGNIGGYAGVLVILIAVVGLTCRSAHRGLRFLLLAWVLVAWAKTFGIQPVMAIMNHLPLLKQADFFRYSPPSWNLALIILAAFGLDDFRNETPSRRWAFGTALGLLAIGIVLAWPERSIWGLPKTEAAVMFVLLGLSIAWALAGLFAAGLAWKLNEERRRLALACLLVFDAAAMFMMPQWLNSRGNRIDTQATRFLRDHQDLSRTYTLGFPMAPNYGAYFQVASIDHNILPVPKLWADYVDRNLLPGLFTQSVGVVFWPVAYIYGEGTGERALSEHLANYLNLGVRYVITNSGHSPIPTTLLPMVETEAQSDSRFGILDWASSVIRIPAKPATERSIAKAILKMGHSPALEGQSIETSNANHITLQSGQSAELTVPAPAPAVPGSPITSIGAVIDNYGNTTDGDLAVEICAGTVCQSGQRALSESTGNAVFQIPLENPFAAPAGAPLHLTFRHQGGSRPVALAMASATAVAGEQLETSNRKAAGYSLQLAFQYGLPLQGMRKVYADSLMDIWELPGAAPYFQIIQGGPCTFLSKQRETVTVECSAPATLLRRELYMPDWHIKVNGMAAMPVHQDGIFQSSTLPVGRSHARYRFVPPYMDFGWAASLVGIAGLLWQIILIGRSTLGYRKLHPAIRTP